MNYIEIARLFYGFMIFKIKRHIYKVVIMKRNKSDDQDVDVSVGYNMTLIQHSRKRYYKMVEVDHLFFHYYMTTLVGIPI
jgi:hypothetical protein